jgi:hypothetical protein
MMGHLSGLDLAPDALAAITDMIRQAERREPLAMATLRDRDRTSRPRTEIFLRKEVFT